MQRQTVTVSMGIGEASPDDVGGEFEGLILSDRVQGVGIEGDVLMPMTR